MNDLPSNDEDNIIAALEYPDRVCDAILHVTGSQLGKIATVMQKPFPVLTKLSIHSNDENTPVLPVGFLGGSAPCLHSGIPCPALPTLLFSASNLVKLQLFDIPPTGYISPEVMIVGLAALPRLKTFHVGFRSATPRPDRIHAPSETRTVLPSLTSIDFEGANEYLEDLVARIDSPQLNEISIFYLNQPDDFQVVQFSKFVDRSVGHKLALRGHLQQDVRVKFTADWVCFAVHRHASGLCRDRRPFSAFVSFDWEISHLVPVLSQLFTTLSHLIHFKLRSPQLEGTTDVEWQLLFHQLSTAQTLHVSQGLAGHFALALEDITGEMVTKVLPSLDLICLVGQPASSIEKFVAARQLSGLPITIIETGVEFEERLKSYVGK